MKNRSLRRTDAGRPPPDARHRSPGEVLIRELGKANNFAVERYATQTTAVSYPPGTQELYLVFRSIPGGPTTNLFNLNWFEFGGQGAGTP